MSLTTTAPPLPMSKPPRRRPQSPPPPAPTEDDLELTINNPADNLETAERLIFKNCVKCGCDFLTDRTRKFKNCEPCRRFNKNKTQLKVFDETLNRLRDDETNPADEMEAIFNKYRELIKIAGRENELLVKAINARIKAMVADLILCVDSD